ncbi:prephenate dehydratase [Bifidobacterium eulemuris]|nr:prephenate dehydratase domain-containing protein [Bifidobacterium eulemuris]QOL33001.1 chorismate mutase [Bifidobacterium eulemuris]
MTGITLTYLGPEGTFTHQAAITAADMLAHLFEGARPELIAAPDVPSIMRAVEAGESWGVIAWENNVEGYVVPNLDALIDARDIAGFARVGVDIAFDAFVRDQSDRLSNESPSRLSDESPSRHSERSRGISPAEPLDDATLRALRGATVSAHSHGLAQCKRFIAEYGLVPEPASSNAAACRDLKPGQMAFGPSICGPLYGLRTVAKGVQDYQGAHTEFLVLAPRTTVMELLAHAREDEVAEYETIITFIPLSTGPGVLADLLDVLRDAGLNMTSFISRPIKGHDGTYSFIVTIDAAPWQQRFQSVLTEVAEHGDWVKTLAVYPRRERPNPPVDDWMLPQGGVHLDEARLPEGFDHDDAVRKELLW